MSIWNMSSEKVPPNFTTEQSDNIALDIGGGRWQSGQGQAGMLHTPKSHNSNETAPQDQVISNCGYDSVVVLLKEIEEEQQTEKGGNNARPCASLGRNEDFGFMADQHELFKMEVEESLKDVKVESGRRARRGRRCRCRSGRGRERGSGRGNGRSRSRATERVARRGRTRSRGAAASSSMTDAWRYTKRIVEVYATDEDAPEHLKEMFTRTLEERESSALLERIKTEKDVNAGDEDEDYLMADDGSDAALFPGDDSALRFEWSPMASFKGCKEVFLPENTGSTVSPESTYDAFRTYWDDNILCHIVTETNRYAAIIKSHNRNFYWFDTNIHEILVLFSFWMMLGIVKMPTTKSCFSMHPLLKMEVFRAMFSRQRYENLCRVLHFVDNSRQCQSTDPLFIFGPVLNHLNSKFKECYIPSQNICIDESVTPWKTSLPFKQYIKTKHGARFRIKIFELCESATGYLWSFFVHYGRDTRYDNSIPTALSKKTAIVIHLLQPLLNKGYTLYMNSWFSSPLLSRYLKRNRTDCVGCLREDLQTLPPLLTHSVLQTGEYVARHSDDVTVMAYQNKTKVIAISTCHGIELGLTDTKPPQWKPQLIIDYSKGMGGVDRRDHVLEPYVIERKGCVKWYMKLFKRLLDCSIHNAKILVESAYGTSKDHLSFRLELVEQIIEHHRPSVPRHPEATVAPVRSGLFPASRLTQSTHWPIHLPHSKAADTTSGRPPRRRCTWCSLRLKKEMRTTFRCSACDVPLCLEPCFRLFHTVA